MAQHRKKARYSLFQPLVLPSIRSSDQLTSFEPSLAVPLHLPPTPSIIPQLLNMGCTLAESEELSEYLNSVITEFRSTCQFDYESAWRGIARLSSWDDLQRIAGGVRNVLRHHYSKQVKSWEELVFEFVRKRAERATLNSHRRPAFNTEWTPFLKKCFAQNPYPTPHDQAILAHKTSMSVKQICDWFQNHRNRSKKNGIVVRRDKSSGLSRDFSAEQPLVDHVSEKDSDQQRDSTHSNHKKRRVSEPLSSNDRPPPPNSFQLFVLPFDVCWPRPYDPHIFQNFCRNPLQAMRDCELASFTWPYQPEPCLRIRKRKEMEGDIVDQIVDTFTYRFSLHGPPSKRPYSESHSIDQDFPLTFKHWRYTYLARHPASASACTLPSFRPLKPLPKRRSWQTSIPYNSYRSVSSATSSISYPSFSFIASSSSASSTSSPGNSSSCSGAPVVSPNKERDRALHNCGMKSHLEGFQAYAGPPLGLNHCVNVTVSL